MSPARAGFAAFTRAAAEALAATESLERRIILGGASIRIRCAGPALPDLLLAALDHARDDDPSGEADVTFDVFDTRTSGVHPPRFPWTPRDVGARGEIAGGDGDVRALFHGDLLAPEHDFRAVSVFSRRRAHGALWVLSPDRVPWWERAAPLRTLLHWSLADPPRRLLVHAAAVGGASRGALLIGAGGSGKSTTAVACVEAGMRAAGDDYVLLDAVASVAHPLYGTAKLAPRSLALVPGVATAVRHDGGCDAEKLVVDLAGRWPARMARPVSVDALVIPRIVQRGRTRLVRGSGADALRALAPTTIFQLPGDNRALLGVLAELARRLPAYVLELGGPPSEAVAELDRLLDAQAAA
jgi:hypothetical protein